MSPEDTPIHVIDDAVALEPVGEGLVRGRTVDAWANMVGPFGGTTAATMLQAVLQHPERVGDPLSLTVNFAGPVAYGEFDISVRPVRTNRSSQHWALEMLQDEQVVTTATVVTGMRRETWSDTEARLPDVPAPEGLKPSDDFRGVKWIENYDIRFVEGAMPAEGTEEGPGDSTTTMWVRDLPDRQLDHISLTALCDTFFPRSFLRTGRSIPAGTVTLSIYFLATTEEIAAQGTDFLLGRDHAHRFHGSYHDASARLWGRDGTLLAMSHQMTYFKA